MDVPHLLVDAAMFEPHRWVVGDPAGELFVILQRLFEEFFLKRIELVVEADIRDFGEHMDGMARLLTLGFRLVFSSETNTVLTARATVAVTSRAAAAETIVLCRRAQRKRRLVQGSA